MRDPAIRESGPIRTVPRIDSHQHLWLYVPEDFEWLIGDLSMLRRDFLPTHLEQTLASGGIDAAVAVQAICRIEETEWLLQCAANSQKICGVVGWVPLSDKTLSNILDCLCSDRKFVGVREIAQGQPSGFFDRPDFNRGIQQLTVRQLSYDILVFQQQLPEAIALIDRHPQQRFVLDHAAKPLIASGELEPWCAFIRELALRENVACKLSGLVTEANHGSWTLDVLVPYLDVCVEAFGADRLLAGSDWPVCLVATDYPRWWRTLNQYFNSFSRDETDAIFGGNAIKHYQLSAIDPKL